MASPTSAQQLFGKCHSGRNGYLTALIVQPNAGHSSHLGYSSGNCFAAWEVDWA
jgi:hypothetical protein